MYIACRDDEYNTGWAWADKLGAKVISLKDLEDMTFLILYESAKKGELLLIDGGMCRYHLRRDGQLTIHEIISTRPGAGKEMLSELKKVVGATSIFARCPSDLPSNDWYKKRGFRNEGIEKTRTGRNVTLWRLHLT